MTSTAPDLSIIIPAYDEERRLPRTLARIRDFLGARHLDAEVIIVDDGSRDGTAQVVEQWRAEIAGLRLISNGRNRGKGYSVRQGMLAARGRLALFTDADLSAPIEEAEKLLAALDGHDVAIGSRALDRSLIEIHQARWRELAGILYNKVVQLITGLKVADTQCGFKAFLRERARVVFEQQRIEGFGFDPEILFLARRHGLRAQEIPVRWAHDPDTKVRVFRHGLRMVWDLLLIRWNWLLDRYPRSTKLQPGGTGIPPGPS
jgi:glycosyltransferase involved in cell wall biosynthesis